jgi:hypothetical protein
MTRASGGAAALGLLFLALAFPGWPGTAVDAMNPEMALAEGNRLFDNDGVDSALEVYARGHAGAGSTAGGALAAVLAYNAGTCALRLGRLPEALLWYRRAETARPGDPWLRDNLAMTRRALGDPPPEASLSPGGWLARRRWLAWAGVALAWMALALLVLDRRLPRGLLPLLALLGCAAFAAGTLPGRFGPRAAVLLKACPARGNGLPAGSEVWVRPAEGGGWRLVGAGGGRRCPPEAVGVVAP